MKFLAETALKYSFKHIGIESTNDKSGSFARKLGFQPIDGSNYAIAVNNLIDYFQVKDWVNIVLYLFDLQRYIPVIERQHQAASGF